MKIDTPTSSLGIRGTTGLVEVPEGGTAGGQVSIKLYPDADGRVGRIEVFGRDGAQLGILSRGATGFAVRPGAGGRFTVRRCRFPAGQAERDRSFVRQTFAARTAGRQIIQQRRTLQQQQRNPLRPNQPNPQRPGQCRDASSGPDCSSNGLSCGRCQADSRYRRPDNVSRATTRRTADAAATRRAPDAARHQPGARPTLQQPARRCPVGDRRHRHCSSSPARHRPPQQPGARPTLQQPGATPPGGDRMRQRCSGNLAPGRPCSGNPERRRVPQRTPAGPRKPAKKNEGR